MSASAGRILTSHVGSLPRPADLLDSMKARLAGESIDEAAYRDRVAQAVADMVRRQAECGIDVVTDGEMSKPSFFLYATERLEGLEPRPGAKFDFFTAEVEAFPEYYEEYFKRAMYGGAVVQSAPLFCVGPIRYVGYEAVEQDLRNLQAAVDGVDCVAAFVPSTSPGGIAENDHYGSEEVFLEAMADAMREEYLAIVEAGFLLQIDDPFLCDIFAETKLDQAGKRRKADMHVEAVNHALRGIPEEKVRFHTCYGINEGPRIHEASLADVVGHMLRINAGVYSFEAANARHEHEYHLWETVKLADGKALMPGVITHASNIVEHPELVAERIVRFADRVGRENVIAGADCGFSSQACYHTEVHPTVIWAKFRALGEGARMASERLWG
jgi:5-methyltetrahydropteroyltriglutamate--homocysteine methyltransferase